MEIDRRFKGCSNVNCDMRISRKKQKIGVNYCPKCGCRNTFVCVRCFKEIPDLGPDFRICTECKEKQKEQLRKIVEFAKKVGKKGKETVTVVVQVTDDAVKSELVYEAKKKTKEAVHKLVN